MSEQGARSPEEDEKTRLERIKRARLEWEERIVQVAKQTAQVLTEAGYKPDIPCRPVTKNAARNNPKLIWILNQATLNTGIVLPSGAQEAGETVYYGRGLTAEGRICQWNSFEPVSETEPGEVFFSGFTSRYALVEPKQVESGEYVDKQTPGEDVGVVEGMARLLERYGTQGHS